MTKFHSLAACALFSILPSRDIGAQEMVSKDDAIQNGANSSFAVVRCSALYAIVAKRAGPERLGQPEYDRTVALSEIMFNLATELYASEIGISEENSIEPVARDFGLIGNAYGERMDRNYALTGEAFGSDKLISSDIEFCSALINGN